MLCLLVGLNVYSQEYTVVRYTMEQGLPADEVYEITQDRDGYMWIATTNGLCRYDGFAFREYTNGHIFTEDMPWLFNYHQKIYVLTWSGKLGYIQSDSLHSFPSPENRPTVRYFLRDRNGGYWFSTVNGIIHMYRGKMERMDPLSTQVYETRDGKLYGYGDGFSYFDTRKRQFIYLRCPLEGKHYKVFGGLVVEEGRLGRCVVYKDVGMEKKIMQFDLRKDENGKVLPVQHLVKRNADEYWLQDQRNILVYDSLGTLRENITREIYEKKLRINTFFIDREDNIWVGTQGKGLFLLKRKPVKNTFPVNDAYISQLAGNANGDIMMAHPDGKISLLDHRGGYHTYTLPGSTANMFYGIHASRETFLGVFGYCLFYTDSRWRIHFSQAHSIIKNIGRETADRYTGGYLFGEALTYSCLRRGNGDLWLGTNKGVYVLPAGGVPDFGYTSVKEFRKFDIVRRKNIWAMAPGHELKKAYMMDMKGTGKKTETFVRQILADGRGVIWIATQCEGIFAYRHNVFYHFTKEDGLLSNNVNSIYVDAKNRLWVCSNVGVTYITPEGRIRYITTEDGIRSNQVNGVFVSAREQVYLGTAKGLSMVQLDAKSSFTPYAPVLSKIRVNDSIYPLGVTDLALGYRQNNIRVDFISVSFGSRVGYKYFIDGLSDKWETTEGRSIQLPRLQPGNYRLRIKSVGLEGKESAEVTLLKFSIATPFWKYNTFWAAVVAAAGALVYVAGYYRRKRAMGRLRLRQRIGELEKKALLSQINPHFVFNCLAAIKYLLTDGEVEKTEAYIQKFAVLMRNTLDFSDMRLIALREEICYIENYMALEELRFGAFKHGVVTEDGMDTEAFFLPPMLLQPYIENAIRHGLRPKKGGGRLHVCFHTEDNCLLVKIDDDGIGRKEAARLKENNTIHYQSRGMDISEQRAFLQDIKVGVIDKMTHDGRACGTQIILRIPQV